LILAIKTGPTVLRQLHINEELINMQELIKN